MRALAALFALGVTTACLPQDTRPPPAEVTVTVARLDDILPADSIEPDVMIKIDVQGAEDRVIRGGRAVFSRASIVLIEMSFVPFYEGQPLFEEVHRLLVDCGLRLAGIKNQINDPASGRPLFAHCLYHRPEGAGLILPTSDGSVVSSPNGHESP